MLPGFLVFSHKNTASRGIFCSFAPPSCLYTIYIKEVLQVFLFYWVSAGAAFRIRIPQQKKAVPEALPLAFLGLFGYLRFLFLTNAFAIVADALAVFTITFAIAVFAVAAAMELPFLEEVINGRCNTCNRYNAAHNCRNGSQCLFHIYSSYFLIILL